MHHLHNTATDSLGGLHVMNPLHKYTRKSLRACPPRFLGPLLVHGEACPAVRTVECRVDGYPRPDIRWERAGRPVGKGRRVHMTRSGDRCLLQVRMPCSDEELGPYTCVATNNVGTASSKAAWITGTNHLKMNGQLHTSLSSPKLNGSGSQSRERPSESSSETKLYCKASRIRTESDSREYSPVPKSETAFFTNQKWTKKTDSEAPQKSSLTQKDSVLAVNQKQLSKSMDDCRKHKLGFLNRVKIPDIFTTTKTIKTTNSPTKSKSIKITDTSKLSQPCKTNYSTTVYKTCRTKDLGTHPLCQKTEKSVSKIEMNGNSRSKCSSLEKNPECKVLSNCVKSNGLDNDGVDEEAHQLTTRERIAAYLKRFENSTSSVKLKESQKKHRGGITRKVGSEKKSVQSTEKELPRDETFFGKFRRRMSAVDVNKKISIKKSDAEKNNSERNSEKDNMEYKVPPTYNLEERKCEDNFFGKFRKHKTSSDGNKKKCNEKNSAEKSISNQQSNEKAIVECNQRTCNIEEKENDETFINKFRRRKFSADETTKNRIEKAGITKVTSDLPSSRHNSVDYTKSLSSITKLQNDDTNTFDSGTDTDVNEILHLKDIYGFVNTIPDVELECSKGANNDVKITIPDTFLDVENFEPAKDFDDLGSFKSIDVNLMDTFEDFPIEAVNSIGTNEIDVSSTDSESEVAVLVPDQIICASPVENSIPVIYIEHSPEDTYTESVEDHIQSIVGDCSGPIIEEPTSNCELFKQSFQEKVRYPDNPSIEEEEEVIVVEEEEERTSVPIEVSPSQPCLPARIVQGPQSVTVLRGEAVTLAASFTGHPPPQVTWMKGGGVLNSGGDSCRVSILSGSEMSAVTVSEVTADDSGKYVVSVENDGGGDSRFASVAVVGFPEPPGSEPTASEVTDHSLVVSWYGSMYDGGSVVTGYQVEMATLPDTKWYKVASSVNTSCSVLGLSKGQKYVFRVRAENRYGVSDPSKDSKIICLDDFLQDESSSDEETGEELSAPITVETGTNFTERFDLKEEVGKGRFGTVYRCVDVASGRPRAAKVIRCLKTKDKEKVGQEIDIMSRLQHPKLMQVLAAFDSGKNMIMVMEFISGGELFERVIADDFVLTEQDCILFMRQICSGVAYMHTSHVIHLDLKPENILCKTRSSHKIKIIDFGLARVYNEDESLHVLFGTPEFVAPEIINYEPVCPGSDMWSVGVICYVLLSGLSPFMGDSDTETFANITRGEMDFDDDAFDEISQDAKDFISRLLVKQVKKRLSAEECLHHPWLSVCGTEQKRPLSTANLKRFTIRRKWQKSGNAIRALGRMVSLSRCSLGSSCDSPIGSPTSSRSRSSLVSRSETAESGESDVFQER